MAKRTSGLSASGFWANYSNPIGAHPAQATAELARDGGAQSGAAASAADALDTPPTCPDCGLAAIPFVNAIGEREFGHGCPKRARIVLRRFNAHVFEGRAANPTTAHATHGAPMWVLVNEEGVAIEWCTWRAWVVEDALRLGLDVSASDVGADNAGRASIEMPCPAYDGPNRTRGAA